MKNLIYLIILFTTEPLTSFGAITGSGTFASPYTGTISSSADNFTISGKKYFDQITVTDGILTVTAGSTFLAKNTSSVIQIANFGVLSAIGDPANLITFSADNSGGGNPGTGSWGNIFFNGAYNSSYISYAIIENGTGRDEGVMYGGGIYVSASYYINISNCIIRNCSSDYGSAICFNLSNSPSAGVTNCLFYGNSGAAAIQTYNTQSTRVVKLINCTIVNNSTSALDEFAGIQADGGKLFVINCILWNNTEGANNGRDISVINMTPANFYVVETSAIQDLTSKSATNIILSATNGDVSGPNFVNPSINDYNLSSSSPCIDNGENSDTKGTPPATDILGNPRVGTTDMGAYENQDFNWQGDDGTNPTYWNVAANWDRGVLPGVGAKISIGNVTNDPIVNKNDNVSSISIATGGILTIDPTYSLTISNAITNNGTLNLRSDVSGTSSLITGSASGSGYNVERYMTGGSGNVWHNTSSPVSDQNIYSFITNGSNAIPTKGSAPTTYGMEFYDENAGLWTYYTSDNLPSSSTDTFIPGYGYMTRRTADGIVKYSGTLNSGNVSATIYRNHYGWNSLGNPYPSSIGINTGTTSTNFLGANSANLDSAFVYVRYWSGTAYTTINNSSSPTYFQPGQGFLVKSKTGGGSVSFTFAMQAHAASTFYKKSSAQPWDMINLKVNTDTTSAFTKILFRDDMTRGLDISYDAGQFTNSEKLQIYSKLVDDYGISFDIQCLPSMDKDAMIVPIGLNCTDGGLVSINAEISSLPAGYIAVLEDRDLDLFTDLAITNSKYEINLPPQTAGFGRFYLHLVSGTNSIDLHKKQIINTFAVNKEIYIKGITSENSIASIYDLMGRKIEDFKLEPSPLNTLNVNSYRNGVYIVKISDKTEISTTRVFVGE